MQMEPPSSSSSSSSSSRPPPRHAVLPNCSDLSRHQTAFLDKHFTRLEDLPAVGGLAAELSSNCDSLDHNLAALRGRLTKFVVSWIYRSVAAKSSMQKIGTKLENLSLCTCRNVAESKRIEKLFQVELPQLAREVQLIENLRKYVETALRLEVLVGDLEDAAFCIMNRHRESGFNQEKLLHAVKAMNCIEEMLVGVLKSQTRWHCLLRSVDNRVDQTLTVLRPKVIADHRALLASLGWPPKLLTANAESGEISSIPNPLVLMQGDKRKRYSSSFLALSALQHLQKRREQRKQNNTKQDTSLWTIDELVSPIAARAEYHFTKWANQPEFMFALVFKITRDFIVGVEDVLQPLIDEARLISFSAREAWVFSMVQMLADFLKKKVFPVLAESYNDKPMRGEVSSSWLHLIDLVVAFDKRMQSLVKSETCLYMDDQTFQGLPRGISVLSIFCEMPIWLKIWARIEFKDAWKKLKAEFEDDRAWMLKPDSGFRQNTTEPSEKYLFATREDYKALPIVDTVQKIAWVMVERCQSIPSIPLRVQFIRSTTVRFIWHFFNLLISHCQIKALRADSDDDVDDDGAIARVCLSINTARYLENKLQEWSDDVNFLDMSIMESDETCFFREEIKGLAELETSWLMEIINSILRRFEILSLDYVQKWEEFEIKQDLNFTISSSLLEALDALRTELHNIKTTLNAKDFLDLWRSIADGLDHFIFCSIITSAAEFSNLGICRFGAEMRALYLSFQPYCARPEAFLPCIRDSLKVLNMSEEEAQQLMVVLSASGREGSSLHSFGVSQLSYEQVLTVLRKRMF